MADIPFGEIIRLAENYRQRKSQEMNPLQALALGAAKGIGTGIETGITENTQKKAAEREYYMKAIDKYTQGKELKFMDKEGKKRDATIPELMFVKRKMLNADFKVKQDEQGNILVADKKNNLTNFVFEPAAAKSDTVTITPDEREATMLRQYIPGMKFEAGKPVSIPKDVYAKAQIGVRAEPKMDIQKLRISMQNARQNNDISNIVKVYRDINKEITKIDKDMYLTEENKLLLKEPYNDLLDEYRPLHEYAIEEMKKKYNIPPKRGPEPEVTSTSSRDKAIKWLQDRRQPVVDENIEAVIKKFGW